MLTGPSHHRNGGEVSGHTGPFVRELIVFLSAAILSFALVPAESPTLLYNMYIPTTRAAGCSTNNCKCIPFFPTSSCAHRNDAERDTVQLDAR
jgi:hypothetical protein